MELQYVLPNRNTGGSPQQQLTGWLPLRENQLPDAEQELIVNIQGDVAGLRNNELHAFGMEIPLDRCVYLLKEDSLSYYHKEYECMKVQVLDVDQDGNLFVLPDGMDPESGAWMIKLSDLSRILVPPEDPTTEKSESGWEQVHKIVPHRHFDQVFLDDKVIDVFGMELPTDRPLQVHLRGGEVDQVRAIYFTRGQQLIARSAKNFSDGPCHLIPKTMIEAVRFQFEAKELRQSWMPQTFCIHTENIGSVSTESGYWSHIPITRYGLVETNPVTYLPSETSVQGIKGNYIEAFGMHVPLDRPVQLLSNGKVSHSDIVIQIIDISQDGHIYYLPLSDQQNYGVQPWNATREGARSFPIEGVRGITFAPDPDILPEKPGETVLYPKVDQKLYKVSTTEPISVQGIELPFDRKITVESHEGETFDGRLVWFSHYGEILMRPVESSERGGCLSVNLRDVRSLAVDMSERGKLVGFLS